MRTIKGAILSVMAAMTISACGMNGQEPGSATTSLSTASTAGQTVGMAECLGCHSDEYNPGSLKKVVGDSGSAPGWITGPHANILESPSISSITPCGTACHNQLGDGDSLAAYGDPALGLTPRAIIGCESCHGSGADHFGTGRVEFVRPDPARCGQCHNEDFPHESTPSGWGVYEKYSASRHSTSVETAASHVSASSFDSTCSRCHSDEKQRGVKPDASGYSNVQCRTCHDPHDPYEYQAAADIVNSAQYNTCTRCHETSDANHGASSTHSWEDYQGSTRAPLDPALVNGPFDAGGMISDTHWDNPATKWIEGYFMNTSDPRSCSACHDVHEARIQELDAFGNYVSANSINEQWARSAHAGHLLDVKEEALETAYTNGVLALSNTVIYDNTMTILDGSMVNGPGVTKTDGDLSWPGPSFAYSRANLIDQSGGECRRCHTSTGFKYLAENKKEPYDAVNTPAFFGFYNTSANEREMVYCWACHEKIGSSVRRDYFYHGHYVENELIFNDIAPYSEPYGRIVNVPDLAASNVCMACHSGRSSGTQLQAGISVYNVTGMDFADFETSHYAAAGGIMFRTIGFENAPISSSYDDPAGLFSHGTIGLGESEATWGDNGPCVACHMKHEEGHSMEAAVINSDGVVTGLPAYENTCSLCHGTDQQAFLDEVVNVSRAGFLNALDVLEQAILDNGITMGGHPYFYFPDGTTPYDNWSYPELMAAFNFNLLSHEPGAYLHNSRYAKRLIRDTLNVLYTGNPDGNFPIDSSKPAYEWLGSGVRP